MTTCLIGCDPGVTVRPFWTREQYPAAFLQALGDWGDLHELRLLPGESILKLSRHHIDDRIFTWMALYVQVDPYRSMRKYGFLGAGLLLDADETVAGAPAVAHLDQVVSSFLSIAAPERKLTLPLADLTRETLPFPETTYRLEASIEKLPGRGGLRPRADRAPGKILFIDISDPGQNAHYMEAAQRDPQFREYHTLLLGRAPAPSDERTLKKLEIVTHQDFLDRAGRGKKHEVRASRSTDTQRRTSYSIPSVAKAPSWAETGPSLYDFDAKLPARPTPPVHDRFYHGMVVGIMGTAAFFVVLTVFLLLVASWSGLLPERSDPTNTAINGVAEAPETESMQSPSTLAAAESVNAFFQDLADGREIEARGRWTSRGRANGFGEVRQWRQRFTDVQVRTEQPLELPRDGDILQVQVPLTISASALDGSSNTGRGRAVLRRSPTDAATAWYIDSVTFDPPIG